MKTHHHANLLSILTNLGLAIVKGAAGFFGHSYALIADAVESLSDAFLSVVIWLGITVSTKPPDENHPYGHGKAEPITALIGATALLVMAFGIGWHSLSQLGTEKPVPHRFTLFVLLGVILIKELAFRYLHKTGKDLHSTALKTDAWHHRSDALTSVAAFIGIAVAIVGGPEYRSADNWAAVLAAIVIGFNALMLMRPAFSELMDEAPDPLLREKVIKAAESQDNIRAVETCHLRKAGLTYFVELHLEVDPEMTVYVSHALAHAVKEKLLGQFPMIADVLIHIEPHHSAV
ncbi:MAG: cation diffusion facilitator family transporter [Candidatus Margulisiibacteriota bacterium]